jgi:tight adherence protein C
MPNETALPPFLGIDLVWAGTILAGMAAFATMLAVYAAISVRDPMQRRIKALADRRDELRAGVVQPARKRPSLVRTNATADRMGAILSALKLLQDSQVADVRRRLAQAGIRKKELAVAVIFAQAVLPIAFGLAAALPLYGLDFVPDWSGFKKFMFFAAVVVLGYKAPDLFVRNLVARRTDLIRKGLPDALDLLVICAEAGLTVDAAFNRVARELGRGYPELGDEFALTAIELSFLHDRRQAFDNFASRVDLEAIRGVATTMVQTERYGTPLASALRVLSAEFRHERMMRAEEKAARLPAIMTVPLILFILPVLFIVILGPAACSISDTFSGGGVAAVSGK